MKRFARFALVAALLFITACILAQQGEKPKGPEKGSLPDRYLCVIVLDGCCPDYFALADMPNLKELTSRGITRIFHRRDAENAEKTRNIL
jgi:hypothetical protein